MEKFRNSLIVRGGGYRAVPRPQVEERVERFVKKTRNTTVKELREPWRGLVVYTLVQYFGWEIDEAADYVGVCNKTAKNSFDDNKATYNMAALFTKNSYNGSKFIFNLRDYIYYNIYRK